MSATLHKLVIIHTNDIHSHFEQMPQVSAAIEQTKREYDNCSVITIDCGDHMDRMRMETEGSHGLANVAVMNETGYDMAVLGNNEGLTFSMEQLAEAYGKHASFLVIGSNLRDASTGTVPEWMLPYHIVERDGIRVGFIGVTAYYPAFYSLLAWQVQEPLEATAHWVGILRNQVDVIVVISHLGLPNDQRLAKEVEGIDLILGGHTHHLLEEPMLVERTYLCAAGKFGQYVGVMELQYDLENKNIASLTGRCLRADEYAADEAIVHTVQQYRQLAKVELSELVVKLEKPLAVDWREESPFGNLLAAGIRKWVNAEVGLVNAGQLLQSLCPGMITKEQLLHLCPSPINPCSMLLRGDHIMQALEESLLPDFQEKPIYGFGFRGKMLGTLCLDGMTVHYNEAAEPYHKIIQAWVNGSPLDKDKQYRVGTIDMFTFGIGYLSFKQGTELNFFLPEFLRNVIEQELNNSQAIENSSAKRWFNASLGL